MNVLERLFGRTGGQRTHLDYASTTPVHPEVLKVMEPYWRAVWANPNALYREGVQAREAVERSRTRVARTLGVRTHDVIFTSGGTESNNLAILGYIEALRSDGRTYDSMEVLTTEIEHPSVLRTIESLSEHGVRRVMLRVDVEGRIDPDSLRDSLSPDTVLASFAYVNSEIGTVQRVRDLSRIILKHNHTAKTPARIHVDASQAPLWLPCSLEMLGVDMLTLDAGKCYGPKGVGILALRHWVKLVPTLHGGGQERGLRSGTENVPLIVGCAEAVVRAQAGWKSRSEAAASLRDFFIFRLREAVPNAVLNGPESDRVANNVNISIPGVDSEFAVIALDKKGIAASTKSACGVGDARGSVVIRACTGDDARAHSSIRFTFGKETTKTDIERAVRALAAHAAHMKTFHELHPGLKN